jgi:hypothetical protein
MKLIIAGSRDINLNPTQIEEYICKLMPQDIEIIEVISGNCKGVDMSGEKWAEFHNIHIKLFKPNWNLGLKAGPMRNKRMAEYGDALLLVWDGQSKGSKNMKVEMLKLNKPIYEVILKKELNE